MTPGKPLTINWEKVWEFNVRFLPPVTAARKVEVRGNSVIFQNTGESTVVIDNVWQIPAGGSFQFGDTSSLFGMIVQEFKVSFSNTGQQTDRCQIAVMVTDHPALAHYVDQNTRRE